MCVREWGVYLYASSQPLTALLKSFPLCSLVSLFSCITYLLLGLSCWGGAHWLTTPLRRGDEQRCWAKTLEIISGLSYINDGKVADNGHLSEWEMNIYSFFLLSVKSTNAKRGKTSLSAQKKILFLPNICASSFKNSWAK